MGFRKLLSKIHPYSENNLTEELFQNEMSLKDKAIMYGKRAIRVIEDHWDIAPLIYAGYSLGNWDFTSALIGIGAYCGGTVVRWIYSTLRGREPIGDKEWYRILRNMGIGFASFAFTSGLRSNNVINATSWYLLGGTLGGGNIIFNEETMLKKK